MRLAVLLSFALALVVFTSNGVDCTVLNEASDPVGDDCSGDKNTEKKILGGSEIKQDTIRIKTEKGCIRILAGGTVDRYTVAGSCEICERKDKDTVCLATIMSTLNPKCNTELGPDCKLYAVAPEDSTKACP